MRSGAAAAHPGLFHEAAFYDNDAELLDIAVPFLLDGIAAGEPTFAVFPAPTIDLVRDALPDASGVTLLDASEQYLRPASTIRTYRGLVDDLLAGGAQQVRVTGTMPNPNLRAAWNGWARYEAAVNAAFADDPLWGLCLYDTRITPFDVLADVGRTHPWIAVPGGRHNPNANYQDPARFLDDRLAARPEHVESTEPALELTDPGPAVARVAVRGAALACGLERDRVDDLVAASQEAVVNALIHGRGPVRVRVWVGLRRTVVTVTDRGPGPSDPFAGLLPASETEHGGFGLWLIHQLCEQVTMSRDEHGFTIRLVVGRP